MNISDIEMIVELLKLAKISSLSPEDEEKPAEIKDLNGVNFSLPTNMDDMIPIVSVDGSYSFLFSFLGAETWIVLFRIAVTEYMFEMNDDKMYYNMHSPPKVYDHLNLISFNESVLAAQPEVYSNVASVAERFQERKAQIFASNIMTYLEDKALEEISESENNCILLKDGALLTFKALKREDIYKNILLNCRMNDIMFAGISKSTSTHLFGNVLTDDYFLKTFYETKYPDLTYIYIPKSIIEKQTKFDVWGEVHFAKLHKEASKWFRVDIGHDNGDKNKLFSSLGAYSLVQLLPGYPIGLIEAHKLAKSVRDLKESYELELLESLKNLNLKPQDILDGTVDMDGRQFNSFHEILDKL